MEQDKFEKMFELQKAFQRNFFDPDDMSEEDKIKFSKENILALHRELGEVLNEMPWKHHRANSADYDIEKIREELIDVYKFFLNVCIIWGMDAKMFEYLFEEKTRIVQERYDNEKDNIK